MWDGSGQVKWGGVELCGAGEQGRGGVVWGGAGRVGLREAREVGWGGAG